MRGKSVIITPYTCSPCKDCPKRKSACHDTCKHYQEWKLEVQKINDLIRKERDKSL